MRTLFFILFLLGSQAAMADAPAEQVLPSVVSLEVKGKAKLMDVNTTLGIKPNLLLQFVELFQNKPDYNHSGSGSGFIISNDGYIVTNAHVVKNIDRVRVRLNDGRYVEGKIVGRNDEVDVGLVKIEGSDYKPLKIGSVDALKVGEAVFAVGSGALYFNSVTQGIVSAKDRAVGNWMIGMIQTDCFTTHGNSGGALFNMNGEVIGITSGGDVSEAGLKFVVPIDAAMHEVARIKAGKSQRGNLSVIAQDVPENEFSGALILDVEKGGAADKAGLKKDDVVKAINGKPIRNALAMRVAVAQADPGDMLNLVVVRGGSGFSLAAKVTGSSPNVLNFVTVPKPGFNVAGLILEETDGKLVVKDMDSSVVKTKDVILAVNGKPVSTAKEFDAAIRAGDNRIELVRNSAKMIVGLSV